MNCSAWKEEECIMAARDFYDNSADDEDDPPDPNPALTSLNITLIEHVVFDADKDPFATPLPPLQNTEPIPVVKDEDSTTPFS